MSATSSDWDPAELQALRVFFLDEAAEYVRAIADAGREPSRTGTLDRPARTTLLRKLHSLKGAAGSVELRDLERLAHELETVISTFPGEALPEASREALGRGITELERELERVRIALAERRDVEPASSDADPSTAPLPPQGERRRRERRLADLPAETTFRIEVSRVDELLDAGSELIIDRSRLVRRLGELEGCSHDLELTHSALQALLFDQAMLEDPSRLSLRLGELVTELGTGLTSLTRCSRGAAEDVDALGRTSATIQERIRRVRMTHLERAFAQAAGVAEEAANREGRLVEVTLVGAETELDKAVVDRISEPLLHLVRNAIAHGIEAPEERRAAGKPEIGRITLAGRREGEAVVIEIADDGRGLDPSEIRRHLIAQGRLAPDEAAQMSPAALARSLFLPGFSTRERRDALAGRGIGLDAVKAAVEELRGDIRVSSAPRRGTRFTITLPLATAIEQALLFKVGGHVYAVANARVVATSEISSSDLVRAPTGDRVRLDGEELPLVRTGALLGAPTPPGRGPQRGLIVLSYADGRFAITCDKLIGPREIVVRSLGPLLADLPLYAGATVSGAGKVQLVLDVGQLAAQAARGLPGDRPIRAVGPERVLVVDDSRSVREAVVLSLEQAGLAAEALADGGEAWDVLRDRPFDLLITDLEMPEVGGMELLDRVRREPGLAHLPILVLSARTSPASQEEARRRGADSFVAKPVRRRVIVDAVRALLKQRRRS